MRGGESRTAPERTERNIQAYGPGFNGQAGDGQESGSVHSSGEGGCRFFHLMGNSGEFPISPLRGRHAPRRFDFRERGRPGER